MKHHSDPRGTDRLSETQMQVDDLKGIMVRNIDLVAQRGEKIELLIDKTENLVDSSVTFKTTSRNLARAMCMKNLKLFVLILFVCLVILYAIVSASCGGLDWPNCVKKELRCPVVFSLESPQCDPLLRSRVGGFVSRSLDAAAANSLLSFTARLFELQVMDLCQVQPMPLITEQVQDYSQCTFRVIVSENTAVALEELLVPRFKSALQLLSNFELTPTFARSSNSACPTETCVPCEDSAGAPLFLTRRGRLLDIDGSYSLSLTPDSAGCNFNLSEKGDCTSPDISMLPICTQTTLQSFSHKDNSSRIRKYFNRHLGQQRD
ncbi:hypothetical protein WMY93_020349 [Mugilogobius chulae]|uniref:Vesicle-associated membrane protein 7 n=1 Tax=Mugilogobius chulae TaxID=88201 RepID=A0AAW0NNQ0_9GOBI